MPINESSFPLDLPVTADQLKESHTLLRLSPIDNPAIAYEVLLPHGWLPEEGSVEAPGGIGTLTRIGLFLEKVAANACMAQVSVATFPVEVEPRDWLQLEAERNGITLVCNRDVLFTSGPAVDAGGLYKPGKEPWVVRMVVVPDGSRLFLVMTMAPEARYPELMRDMAILVSSFELLNPTGSPQLERLEAFVGSDPGFTVRYPASWDARAVPKHLPGKSGLDLVLSRKQDMLGYVRVKAIDPALAGDEPPEALLQTAEAEMGEAGLIRTSSWANDDDPTLTRFDGIALLRRTTAKLKGRIAEVRFGLVQRGPLRFAMTLLAPLRGDDAIVWMRAKRAYAIALGTALPV